MQNNEKYIAYTLSPIVPTRPRPILKSRERQYQVLSIETTERIELVFGMEASCHLFYTVF